MYFENKRIRILTIYYGLWQFIHLIFNLYSFFIDWNLARNLLGFGMTDDQFTAVVGSGLIDLTLAHVSAFLYVFSYFKRRPWASSIGIFSLTIAIYSSFLVTYLQISYNTWQFELSSFLLTWIPFIPVILLLFETLFAKTSNIPMDE